MNVRGSSVALMRLKFAPLLRLKLITAFEFVTLNRSAMRSTRYLLANRNDLSQRKSSKVAVSDRLLLMFSRKKTWVPAFGNAAVTNRAHCQPLCERKLAAKPTSHGNT